MPDPKGPIIAVTEPRIKFVLALAGILGLGYSIAYYIVDKEHRLQSMETELKELADEHEFASNAAEQERDKIKEDLRTLERDHALLKAWVTERFRRGPYNSSE